jgi:hypothetical protein
VPSFELFRRRCLERLANKSHRDDENRHVTRSCARRCVLREGLTAYGRIDPYSLG